MTIREKLRPFFTIQFVAWMATFGTAWGVTTGVAMYLELGPAFTVLLGIVAAWSMNDILDTLTDAYVAERGEAA